MSRALLPCLILSTVIATPAQSLTLNWSSGPRNLQTTAARTCTLVVRADLGSETLPPDWELIWVAESATTAALSIQADPLDMSVADVCEYRPAASPASTAAHVDTALHCTTSSNRANTARYVLSVTGDVRAKLKLLTASAVSSGSMEVTINGGLARQYPPSLTSVHGAVQPGSVTVIARGDNLDVVTSATLVPDAGSAVPLTITGREDRAILLSATNSQALPTGLLELRDDIGGVAALEFDAETMQSDPGVAVNQFLIWFDQDAVQALPGGTSGSIEQFTFAPTALGEGLSGVGVTRLDRLFPWFRHEDVETKNFVGEPVRLVDLTDVYVATLAAGAELENAVAVSRTLAGVRQAEPDIVIHGTMVPDDPRFVDQWGLHNTGQSLCGRSSIPLADIGAIHAWNATRGDPSVSIAILDSGIDNTHEDLAQFTVLDTSFVGWAPSPMDDDPNRHGTAVAGLAGAAAFNQTGISGVASRATLRAVKVLAQSGGGSPYGFTSWIAAGIDWARQNNIPIINMSFGTRPGGLLTPDSVSILNAACLNAYLKGCLLVSAAGNINTRNQPYLYEEPGPVYPACFSRRVLGVGAMMALTGLTPAGMQRWSDMVIWPSHCNSLPYGLCRGSNYWENSGIFVSGNIQPFVDLVAPGGRFVVTTKNGPDAYYELDCDITTGPPAGSPDMGFGGTSAATPIVAGVAALLPTVSIAAIGDEFQHILEQRAFRTPRMNDAPGMYGWGLVRADYAVDYVKQPNDLTRGILLGNELKVIELRDIGYNAAPLHVVDSTSVSIYFDHINPAAPLDCKRYRLRGDAEFVVGYTGVPDVWVRGSGSMGASDSIHYNPRDMVPWGRVLNRSSGTAELETFVYRVPGYGWIPGDPREAAVAWSAVGPRSVTGVAGNLSERKFALRLTSNPIVGSAWIELHIPRRGQTLISILDITGRVVRRLTNAVLDPGVHQIEWDGRGAGDRSCPAGVYFIRAEQEGRGITEKVALLHGGRK